MNNKLSKFCHIYEKDGKTFIYHSLKMIVNDITGSTYNDTNRTLENIDSQKKDYLSNNGFIIDNDDPDKNLLLHCLPRGCPRPRHYGRKSVRSSQSGCKITRKGMILK